MKKKCMLVMLALLMLTACGKNQEPVQTTVLETIPVIETTQVVETTEIVETTVETEPLPEPAVFDLVVRHRPLSTTIHADDLKAGNQYPFEHLWIDDVPILISIGEGTGPKPIYIYLHPAGSRKDNYAREIYEFAKETGGIGIAVDAGGSGNSNRGKMTGAESVCGWISDVDKVIAYCSTLEGADLGHISLAGRSMGGSGTMAYLAHGAFKLAFAHAEVPCADFTMFPKGKSAAYFVGGNGSRSGGFLTLDEIEALLKAHSPIDQAQRMMEPFVLVSVGLQDSADSVESCKALEAKFQELGKENCRFDYYDAGHDLPEEAVQQAESELLRQYGIEGDGVRNANPVVTVTEKPW